MSDRDPETTEPRLHGIDGAVFADEVEAIVARREIAARRPDPGSRAAPQQRAGTAEELRAALEHRRAKHGDEVGGRPSPALGLAGLSLSGGGIRSATFNLGVLQVFAKRGLLRWFDYLSTVSGGGYIGSALSSTLLFETEDESAGGREAPFGASFVHRMGHDEPRLIKHLRSGRDYLAPGGIKDLARIPAVLLRGIVVNLLVVTPLIGLLAVVTAVAPPFGVYFHQLEFTGFSAEQLGRGDVILENAAEFFLPTLLFGALFVVWSAVFPFVATLRRRAPWAVRNRFELGFSSLLLAIGVVGAMNALPYIYYVVFNGTFEHSSPWRVGVAALAAVLPIATSLRNSAARSAPISHLFVKLRLLAAGLLGPLILLSMYLGMALVVLEPLTYPFGTEDSALNVAARVLAPELEEPTSSIVAASDPSVYETWAHGLWESLGGDPDDAPADDTPYYEFLVRALEADNAHLAASLGPFKRQFRPAIALRLSPIGMRLFGENRFIEPLRKNLDIDPRTREPYASVAAGELIFRDASRRDQALALARASEELRKDIVLTHSAILLALMALLASYVTFFVDVNKTGLHRFYRDRLSLAYLYDPRDPDGTGGRADNLKLTEIDPSRSGGPYHLVNAALNIPATEIADLQGRASDFFVMAPRWSGSSASGHTRTADFEEIWDRDTTLATALAVSGAAAAPQMGVHTSKTLTLIMTLLNIRLDYWVPNPAVLDRRRHGATRVPGPTYLLREISGQMTVRTPFINLSDGGHIENLGLYALLRRRCKYIIACDAEQDIDLTMPSLGKLTAYARMDDGIWIDWGGTLGRLARNAQSGFSSAHWAIGKIHYGHETGRIIYIKSSMCGHEWPDQMAYRAQCPEFPQQSTGEQFFDESQFEAYRALGYLIASQLFPDRKNRVDSIEDFFDRAETLAAPRYGSDHEAEPQGSSDTGTTV